MPRTREKQGLKLRLKISCRTTRTVETKITERENGYLIQVETSEEVAVAVYSEEGERIYLPGQGGSDSTYYNEDPTFLSETENGYAVLHNERPQNIEIIS